MPDPTTGLECYLVGGAVRDRLLDRPVTDRDWVVVGATTDAMRRRGFRAVGADFPVFLHPTTHEQYALARTERKTAPGYRGFAVHAAPDVTLAQDLARRDLTINAIAQTPDGTVIDPYGGAEDIRRRRLRHVSPAFAEDPVRILRVARFAARYAPLGFEVAADTLALMQQMVAAGEADALIAERVWAETERALGETAPARFIEILRACGALARVFPEIDALFGVPQPARYHPEIDAGEHTLLCLTAAAVLSDDGVVRFAALVHDLGKALTPRAEWPRHIGHERRGITPIRTLCERLRVPRGWRELGELVCRYHLTLHRLDELRPTTVLRLLEAVDAFRRPARLVQFALACEADARGRLGSADRPYPQAARLAALADTARAVDLSDLGSAGFTGIAARDEARRRRLAAIRAAIRGSQE